MKSKLIYIAFKTIITTLKKKIPGSITSHKTMQIVRERLKTATMNNSSQNSFLIILPLGLCVLIIICVPVYLG